MIEIDFNKREITVTLFNGDEIDRYPNTHYYVGGIIQWKFPLDDKHFHDLREGSIVKDMHLWYDRTDEKED